MNPVIRPRRSVLYMPGINERALEKARSIPADSLILDLEDSVAPDAKEAARALVCESVRAGGYGNREIVIRINGLESEWGEADLRAAAQAGADAILIPKVDTARDVYEAAECSRRAGAPDGQQLWAMIETPLGVLNAREIGAEATDENLTCLVLGTNDLLKETRARFVPERTPVMAWLSNVVVAARTCGLDVIDGVYNNFRDEDGFEAEARQGRDLGMDGKTLIHPAQVDPCNRIFSPSDEEVAWAERVVEAFRLPESAGKGVITVEGVMVERLHEAMAQRTLAIAGAIRAREREAA